uniref:Syndecan/Neurexin domain-containing protein n=1 Tax=Eptatretus burgeri TaxID=7764 RepID=A0A8C4WQT2_EPTBU
MVTVQFQTDLGEGSGSGDIGPIDDEDDYGSGSGQLLFQFPLHVLSVDIEIGQFPSQLYFFITFLFSGSLEFDPDSDELLDSDSENGSEEDSSDYGNGDGDSVDEEDVVQVDNRILEGSIPNKKSSEIGDDENVVGSNEIAPNVPPLVGGDIDNAIAAKVQSSAQGSSLQRTEVLAAIIAGGVVGLLMAIALIAFLVLRMRKKEEGNCIVGKNAEPAYQRANTEIYA